MQQTEQFFGCISGSDPASSLLLSGTQEISEIQRHEASILIINIINM
jgi:hypothetical protein